MDETLAFLRRVRAEWQKDAPFFYEFAIELNSRQIGAVSVAPDGECAELGWILNRRFHHCGYATEASMAVRDFAMRTLHQTCLYAHCDTRNVASKRVMEKLGFVCAGEGPRSYPDERGEAREYTFILHSDGHFDTR